MLGDGEKVDGDDVGPTLWLLDRLKAKLSSQDYKSRRGGMMKTWLSRIASLSVISLTGIFV